MCGSCEPERRTRSSGRCETRTVLVVDDDPDLTAVAGAYLGRLDGVSVETGTDPRETLGRVDGSVDCVVSDYEMPGMDGLELLAAVRDVRPDLPFVLFTGTAEAGVAERARERGAQFVRKGPSADGFDGLLAAVEAALED
jgi:CheY-like chemotaxis protein